MLIGSRVSAKISIIIRKLYVLGTHSLQKLYLTVVLLFLLTIKIFKQWSLRLDLVYLRSSLVT